MLTEKYPDEVNKILAKYPEDRKRSAIMPLLYLALRDNDHITNDVIRDIAAITGSSETQVEGVVGFYTLYHDEKGGKHYIQICTDLPCALRGADQFAEQAKDYLGCGFEETTADGKITLEHVMCLAACDKAPMFQLQNGKGIFYHENQDIESFKALVDELRSEADA